MSLISKIEALRPVNYSSASDYVRRWLNYNPMIMDAQNVIIDAVLDILKGVKIDDLPLVTLPNRSGTWLICFGDTGRGEKGYGIRHIELGKDYIPKGYYYLLEADDE